MKAQVSNYIVIGLLILFLAIVMTSSSSIIVGVYEQSVNGVDSSPKGFMQSCSKRIITESITGLGLTTGLMEFNDPIIIMMGKPVNIMVMNRSNRAISEDEIIENIKQDIIDRFVKCTEELDGLYPFSVIAGNPSVDIRLTDRSVQFSIYPDMNMDYGDRISILENIYIDYPVRLRAVYNEYLNVVSGFSEFTKAFSLTDLHRDDQINVTVLVPSEDEMVFVFEDYGSDIEGRPFVFIFGRDTQ
ncbi:hypothetical protein K9M79_01105 [Candidatus Woesearchaeota archaeon]|nr:hypothetical protein [Candidatus Woesearchaeota archaeon]